MSNINEMLAQVNALPARGTPGEARTAAARLAATGRRIGAPDWQTRELLAMCGLDEDPDTRRHVDLIKPSFNPSTRVRTHVQSRRKG